MQCHVVWGTVGRHDLNLTHYHNRRFVSDLTWAWPDIPRSSSATKSEPDINTLIPPRGGSLGTLLLIDSLLSFFCTDFSIEVTLDLTRVPSTFFVTGNHAGPSCYCSGRETQYQHIYNFSHKYFFIFFMYRGMINFEQVIVARMKQIVSVHFFQLLFIKVILNTESSGLKLKTLDD